MQIVCHIRHLFYMRKRISFRGEKRIASSFPAVICIKLKTLMRKDAVCIDRKPRLQLAEYVFLDMFLTFFFFFFLLKVLGWIMTHINAFDAVFTIVWKTLPAAFKFYRLISPKKHQVQTGGGQSRTKICTLRLFSNTENGVHGLFSERAKNSRMTYG